MNQFHSMDFNIVISFGSIIDIEGNAINNVYNWLSNKTDQNLNKKKTHQHQGQGEEGIKMYIYHKCRPRHCHINLEVEK